VVEQLHPNHSLAGNVLTAGPGGTPADESIFRYDTAVTQFTLLPQVGSSGLSFAQASIVSAWAVEASALPFLRVICRDCDGQVVSTADTTLSGDPYTVQGEVGICGSAGEAEPCRDTEITQLCDLTYTPQPPIAIPTSSFTRSGTIQIIGGALVFSGGNATPNGVAERAVTGLIDGAGYQLLFDAGWNGAGAPPSGSNAVYRVEVLDGATVLASLDRNLSNGSASAGPLTAQGPLEFIAPASGSVTIRFTDRTTGGGISRDLVILPRTVQTDSVQVTAVPFVRAYTFDCQGQVVGAQDLDLGGGAYTVQGVVGRCPGDSDGGDTTLECVSHLLEECRWDDTDGDGVGDTRYVELISVDACSGTLTTVGTYDEDLTGPYTPVSPTAGGPIEGAPPAAAVQAHRTELTLGASWDAADVPLLQSVTATAHGGTGQITTADGASTLFTGETVTWSVGRDGDSMLVGPLTITAQTGTVTVTYTQGVTL
jgi:hypothetical protein